MTLHALTVSGSLALGFALGCSPCGLRAAPGPSGAAAVVRGPALPVGAPITAAMQRPLDSRHARVGESFTALVTSPVVGTDGRTHVVRGAVLKGHVDGVRSDEITVAFDAIETTTGLVPLGASVLGADAEARESGADAGATRFVYLADRSRILLVLEHAIAVPSADVSSR